MRHNLNLQYRTIIKAFFIGISLLLFGRIGSSQDIKFNHITPDEGFGFGNVWSIIEDHEGFMWFATEDGLIKYDGYELLTFRNNKSDPKSISANFSVCLLEDRYNQLWIGTFGGGLNRYDREKDIFYQYQHNEDDSFSLPHNRVKTLYESKDGNIWVGTEGGGVVTFDPNPKKLDDLKFTPFQIGNSDKTNLNLDMIRSLAEDHEGNMYLGTLDGLIIIDQTRKNFTHLKAGNQFPNVLGSNAILEVFVDSKDRVWIGTLDAGMDLYNTKDKSVSHYSPIENEKTLNHHEIETITEDQNGNIWVGSDNGLSKMDDSNSPVPKNRFTNFFHEPLDNKSLLSNSIKVVYTDSRNALWIGSYYGGINIYNPHLYKFTAIQNKPWVPNSLINNNITSFVEDDKQNLWIGTDGGGLSVLKNAERDIFRDQYVNIVIQFNKNSTPETKVKTLEIDKNGILWIGFWVGGLYSYNPQNGKTTYFGPGDKSHSGLEAIRILDIKVDKLNNLWIATFDGGISYYDQIENKFKTYLNNDDVQGDRFNAILVDSKDRVWTGGDIGGLNLYNPETDSFEQIEKEDILTKNISILSLMETKDGTICIGTVASGIILYNPENNVLKNYTEESGLPNNVIHAVLEDDDSNLWMSTNQGLAMLNTKTQTVINYTKNDGLQGNQFNNGSSLKISNGMFLFGGTNGWNPFYPNAIQKDNKAEKIVYTNFWVNGKLVHLKDEKSPLKSDLNGDSPIELNYKQQSFSVEFALLDYDFSLTNQYAYFLEGFNEDWQYIGKDRKAIFTNLEPGEYKLRIKATNQDGFWMEHPNKLVINIKPAWWQTEIFKYSFISLIVLLVYLFYRIRINFLLKQRNKLEKQVQGRTTELKSKNVELSDKNNEIQAQNEELTAQNEQISLQREELETTKAKLQNINEQLENIVEQRTKKLELTIKQLDKTVSELDRFVYSASHDLSSPLKSIRGLIQIAKIEREPSKILTCINHMDFSVNNLENVIKSLVDYSRNSHLEVVYKQINCHELVNEIIDELKYWPEANDIHINNQIDKKMLIRSDQHRLKIILHNLLGNGIKYADRKKHESYLTISCQMLNDHWELIVSDNGIGIDNEHLHRIFDMYYRASEVSKGSGLGLFIVNESVNKLNGKIHISSQKDVGSTISITFPLH